MGIVALLFVLAVAGILWRVLKRAIGGCISIGIGCLVLVVGVVAIGLYFASRYGITNFPDVLRFFGL